MPDPIGVVTVAARLRKLEAQATPGPWERGLNFYAAMVPAVLAGDLLVAEMGVLNEQHDIDPRSRPAENALLIVSMRNLLPLLADLAEAAEEVRENIDEELDVLLDRVDAALARVADHLDHEEAS